MAGNLRPPALSASRFKETLDFTAIFALTLASALLLTWALLPTGRAQKVRESMGRLDSYSVHDFRRLELAQPGKDRVFKPLLRRLSSLGNMCLLYTSDAADE